MAGYDGVSSCECAYPSANGGQELSESRRHTTANLSTAIAKLTRQVVQLTRRIDYLERKVAARDLLVAEAVLMEREDRWVPEPRDADEARSV